MNEIAIYVEGGGDTADQKAELRQGLDRLLEEVKSKARAKRLGWKLVCAGGRQTAYEAFLNALRTNQYAVNVLLVDSESPIGPQTGDAFRDAAQRVAHLTARDGWDLAALPAERVHLMVQCMEAWIVADAEALAKYYGQGFASNVLPVRPNLEDEPKLDLYDKLARATRNTQKGEYGKIRHASQILQRIDATKVAQRCPHFATFTSWLTESIDAA
jgi:hypothetical protein